MDSVICHEQFEHYRKSENNADTVDVVNGKCPVVKTKTTSLVCVRCRELKCTHFKLLPCLHLCCLPCLESLIESNLIAMPKTEVELKCSIFSCPQCSYVIRIVNGEVSSLKNIHLKSSKNGFCQSASKSKTTFKLNNITEGTSQQDNNSNNNSNEIKSNNLDTCCEVFSFKDVQCYCNTCQIFICTDCHIAESTFPQHSQHNLEPFSNYLNAKKSNANKLLEEIQDHRTKLIHVKTELLAMQENLTKNKDNLKLYITTRAEELCNQIIQHRNKLIDQLTLQYDSCMNDYKTQEVSLSKNIDSLDDCLNFSKEILEDKHTYNFLSIEDELASHINRMLAQQQNNKNEIKIHQFKLDHPDQNRKDQLIEKLLGSLIVGNLGSGISHFVAKYNADISWPCCLATNNKDIVVAGKTESSGGLGKLLFFNKDTKLLRCMNFHDNELPADMVTIDDKHFLLTTNSGEVRKFSFRGETLNKWTNVFEGPFGQMSPYYNNNNNINNTISEVLITSVNNELLIFDVDSGEIKNKIKLPFEDHAIRSISKHLTDDKIFVVFDNNTIQSFDTSGNVINSDIIDFQMDMKCPSSIICDSFGNVLISDFISDRVSLFSRDGRYLGTILDKSTDGVSCPNKLMLDSHYNLYVAQCGGDVGVYNYVSIVKKV